MFELGNERRPPPGKDGFELGAMQLNEVEEGGSRWRTFADPEGNEFDLVATTA